jgi:long-chain acyl-CoA synthetase
MFSMTQMVRRAAQTQPNVFATVDGDRFQTWTEFEKKIASFANGLQQLGIGADGCVAILALNSDRYFEFMFATPWAGAIFQPINTRLAGPEVVYWLNDSEARVLLVDKNFAPMIDAIKDQLQHVKHFVFVDDGQLPEGYIAYADVVDNEPVADANRSGDDAAGLFYTGGTTGRSKGVMLSHTNFVTNALQSLSVLGVEKNSRILHVAPMFHIADAFVCMMSTALSCSNYFRPAFEPVSSLQALQDHKIQRLVLVPTMINMLVNHPNISDYALDSLECIWYGASPMPEPVIRKAMDVLPAVDFCQVYGQTEASPAITALLPDRHTFEGPLAGKLKSAGQALPAIDLCIMDANNQKVANNVIGEICMRGPNMMLGYRNMAEQTANTIVDGWLHTGDGGYLDDEGFLFIVDRVKDMIISGGENVYSAEVESALYQHEAINQCAVIGIPHEKWGEQVHAVVLLKQGATADEAALIMHCKALIAGFKCPHSISFQSEPLPLSGAGKILKTELRKPFWGDGQRNVN